MNSRPEWGWIALLFAARLRRAAYPAARFSMAEFESSQGGVSHIATRAQVLRIARYCEMQSHAATLHGVVGIGHDSTRATATLDCLDLSAAEAGHLLGVHR